MQLGLYMQFYSICVYITAGDLVGYIYMKQKTISWYFATINYYSF